MASLGDYTHKTDHLKTSDHYKEKGVVRITVTSEALREEVLCPGSTTIDEDNVTKEPEEKLKNFRSNKVLTGAHTPMRLKSCKHSTDDENNLELLNDPGYDATLVTYVVGEKSHVHSPDGHRKDAGITDLSREVNSDSPNFKADSDSLDFIRKTHLKIFEVFLYHALFEVMA